MTTTLKVFLILSVLLTSRRTAAFFVWNYGNPRPVSVKLIRDMRMAKRIVPLIPLYRTIHHTPKKLTKIIVLVSPYKPAVPSVGLKYFHRGSLKSRAPWFARRAENNYGYQL